MSSITSLVRRDRYAALERCTYLNQASLGLIPETTIDAMESFLMETARFGNLYLDDDQEAAILDGVRSAGADMLGTSSSAVAVVAGASEGLGQATAMLAPEHGTVILVGSDFPSVTYPWLAAAERRGISLRFIDDRADRDLTQDLVEAIDPATVVVAFSVVQYATGTRVDSARVAERAHEVGARVVVDATQLAGAGIVDTVGWGADALVTSGYKWLSSHGGVALLALAPDLLLRLPGFVGWMGAHHPFDFDPLVLHLADDARRFELSTMSYVSAIGLESSIALLSSLGFERIGEHARRLATHLVDRVAELGWRPFRPPSDPSAAPHIVSLRHADHDPGVTAERLASEFRIICGGRAGGLRISLHAYNDGDDVDQLVEALRRL
ncbi:MAG TPA: aminotransferase class V-fold PLP-dependent enzyme [Actinomycetota bacterium]|nr:aminotransferase class V-fold PLP-dependent enzyme [Actinomycetota bacterium]